MKFELINNLTVDEKIILIKIKNDEIVKKIIDEFYKHGTLKCYLYSLMKTLQYQLLINQLKKRFSKIRKGNIDAEKILKFIHL